MRNEKGFISILTIVIVSILIASAGTGAVLHKQGKLNLNTSHISEVFEQTENDVIAIETEESEKKEQKELQTETNLERNQTSDNQENQIESISETIQKLNTEIQNVRTQDTETQKFSQTQIQKDDKKSDVISKITETTTPVVAGVSTETPVCVSSQEICDGKDNDCDGEIDENITRNCGISDIGLCRFGIQSCVNGDWTTCVGTVEPIQEICDNQDNDCDGQIDEENVCTTQETITDPCVNVNCPVCQYCSNGNCVARPDTYNDCGSGCQRCINGSCQDYNDVCSECQHCNSDVCVNYCQKTDISCGCIDCANCDNLDGWVNIGSSYSCCDEDEICTCQKQDYRNYYCSEILCNYSVDNTRITKSNCVECGTSKICSDGICQPTISTPTPSLNFDQDNQVIPLNLSSFEISWHSKNMSNCLATGDWNGNKSLIGSENFSYSEEGKYTYTLTCNNDFGSSITKSLEIEVISYSGPINVSLVSDTLNDGNITRGSKDVSLLKLNLNNPWNNVRHIRNIQLKLVGGNISDFGSFKIGYPDSLFEQLIEPCSVTFVCPSTFFTFSDNIISLNNIDIWLEKHSDTQIIIKADIPLTANLNNTFHLEFVSGTGSDSQSGATVEYQAVGSAVSNNFTITQPPITESSPRVSLIPNTPYSLDSTYYDSCPDYGLVGFVGSSCYVGTVLRFEAKNKPFSVNTIAFTFDGIDSSDIGTIGLSWAGKVYHQLYHQAVSDEYGAVNFIDGNKVIFRNFTHYGLGSVLNVNKDEIFEVTIIFIPKPSAISKTVRIDLINPLVDIIASNDETGLELPVSGGSIIGYPVLITKQ